MGMQFDATTHSHMSEKNKKNYMYSLFDYIIS